MIKTWTDEYGYENKTATATMSQNNAMDKLEKILEDYAVIDAEKNLSLFDFYFEISPLINFGTCWGGGSVYLTAVLRNIEKRLKETYMFVISRHGKITIVTSKGKMETIGNYRKLSSVCDNTNKEMLIKQY